VAAFYRARGNKPLWVKKSRLRPEAAVLAEAVAHADRDGLDPQRYGAGRLKAALAAAEAGDPAALAKAEVLLTEALAAWGADLHRPPAQSAMVFTDAELPIPPDRRTILASIGKGRNLGARIEALQQMHPAYEGLRQALELYRAEWSSLPQTQIPSGAALQAGGRGKRVAALRQRLGLPSGRAFDAALTEKVRAFQTAHGLDATGRADAATIAALNAGSQAYERRIRMNLDRARPLPADPGARHVLVDAGAAELDLYEGRREVDSMKVIVGKPAMPTPMMAGMIRYAVLNPYWNVPEDLVRDSLSARMIKEGAQEFEKERMQALADWTDGAAVVDPKRIDWRAVAAGRKPLRVRQLPGPDNMIGTVKFMLPNRLGVYLHDTPNRAPFEGGERWLSSGCVRLEDATRLGRWLQGGELKGGGEPEERVDLKRPVPVYITYFTVVPGPDGRAVFRPDVYGRDKGLVTAQAPAP
jgi:murein L,D-transpeptidase YcbB/YkuD